VKERGIAIVLTVLAMALVSGLAIGLVIYFCYSRHHSHLGKELRGESKTAN
jgi:hypothetical protein